MTKEQVNLRDDPISMFIGLYNLSTSMTSEFLGGRDEFSKLLRRIRKTVGIISSLPSVNYIDVFDFKTGYCDQIYTLLLADPLTRDETIRIIQKLETVKVHTDQGRQEFDKLKRKLEPHFVDPAYQVNKVFPVRIIMTEPNNEFRQDSLSEDEIVGKNFAYQVMAWAEQYKSRMNALQITAKDFFFKIPLLIKKNAETFEAQKAYNSTNQNESTGKFQYVTDTEHKRLGSVIFKVDESEKENYETFDDLVGKSGKKITITEDGQPIQIPLPRKAIETKLVYEFTKLNTGNTEEERYTSTKQFIIETKEFERDVLSEYYQEGMTLRGTPVNLDSFVFFLKNFKVELETFQIDIHNPQFIQSPLYDGKYANKTTYVKSVFSKEAIEEDNKKEASEKLGLEDVWGVMYDRGGELSNTVAALISDKTHPGYGNAGEVVTKIINNGDKITKIEYVDYWFRTLTVPFRILVLFMWKK